MNEMSKNKNLIKGGLIIGGSLLAWILFSRDTDYGPAYPAARYKKLIDKLSNQGELYGWWPDLIMAIIEKESGGNPNYVGKQYGVIPRYGLMGVWYDGAYQAGFRGESKDLMHPETNIKVGASVLEYLFTHTRYYMDVFRREVIKGSGVIGNPCYVLEWYGATRLELDPQDNLKNTSYCDEIIRLMKKYRKLYGRGAILTLA